MPQQDQDTVSSVPSEIALAQVRALAARVRAHALAGACVALLASCGGGGGGDAGQAGAPVAPPPSTPAPPPSTPPAPPPPAAPGAVPLVAPGTWVVMGSSTAQGANADTLSWVQALAAGYATRSVKVVNIASGGTVTYSGLPMSSPLVAGRPAGRPAPLPSANVDAAMRESPKLLLLSYPTNDTDAGYTVDETVGNLLAIRSFAQTRGAAVIVLSTQPRPFTADKIAALREIDSRLSAAVGPCFVPVREALGGTTLSPAYVSSRDPSGVHPNDAGHAVIYRLVAEVIDSGKCVRTQ